MIIYQCLHAKIQQVYMRFTRQKYVYTKYSPTIRRNEKDLKKKNILS